MLASIAQDDVERTIRYYNLDGGVIRFPGYAAMKRSKPGIFSKRKGGISAAHTATTYSEEARSAIDSLIEEFPTYLRLPRDGEKFNKTFGFVWIIKQLRQGTKICQHKCRTTVTNATKRKMNDPNYNSGEKANDRRKCQKNGVSFLNDLSRFGGFKDYTWGTDKKTHVETHCDLHELLLQMTKLRWNTKSWSNKAVVDRAHRYMRIMENKLGKGEKFLNMDTEQWRTSNIANAEIQAAKMDADVVDEMEVNELTRHNQAMNKIRRLRQATSDRIVVATPKLSVDSLDRNTNKSKVPQQINYVEVDADSSDVDVIKID